MWCVSRTCSYNPRIALTLARLAEISKGLAAYRLDNDDRMPPDTSSPLRVKRALSKYIDPQDWIDPITGQPWGINPRFGGTRPVDLEGDTRTLFLWSWEMTAEGDRFVILGNLEDANPRESEIAGLVAKLGGEVPAEYR